MKPIRVAAAGLTSMILMMVVLPAACMACRQCTGAVVDGGRLSYANPIDLPYRMRPESGKDFREGADPDAVFWRGRYWLFASKCGGYFVSGDLASWKLVQTDDLPLEEYAPSAWVMEDQLYFSSRGGSVHVAVDADAGIWRRLDGRIPFTVDSKLLYENGRLFDYYGGFTNDVPLWMHELDPATFAKIGERVPMARMDDGRFGWDVSGDANEATSRNSWKEGAYVMRRGGSYYFQYATPGTQFASYCDVAFIGTNPRGPFRRQALNPFSYKPGGYAKGAGHGCTFADRYGNWWHITTCVVKGVDRRLVMLPVFFDDDGEMWCDTAFADWPFVVPDRKTSNPNDYHSGWMPLTYGKEVKVSSSAPESRVQAMVDEDMRTSWSAATGNPGEWAEVDLGGIADVSAVQIGFAEAGDIEPWRSKAAARKWRLEVSEDGSSWKCVVDESGAMDAPDHPYRAFGRPVRAARIRVTCAGLPVGNRFALREIRAFGRMNMPLPSPVSGIKAVRDKSDRRRATLSWNASKGAEGYIVRYGPSPAKRHLSILVRDACKVEVRSLDAEQEYFWGVEAFNAAGFAAAAPTWPAVTREMRPWCYNWWMGSAVDEKGLEAQADALSKAGFGGFHVIPIYGAKGWEPKYREFLSESWMAAFADAVRTGASRDLGVDLTMGSGWCFGGPQLAAEDGCWRLFTTADANEIKPGMKVLWKGTDSQGRPRILAAALTGQQVKRAGLGGKGPMMDPYSTEAMDRFLAPYTAAFDRPGAVRPEHLYHDSFEYFRSAWTPGVFDAFKAKRGYDLREHLAELAGVGSDDAVARVKCDYRETLSDLIIEDVFPRWFDWCRRRGIATRNEAHGAPANWLDFYALADIPETEMFSEECRDVLVSKFASSAAHVTGKPMVSSESCTWLGQHFTETLADAKVFIDRLFLSGVNHMFYHGCCYSPVEAPWPGWCFYASAQMNPRNTVWRDTDALSAYITRCQSVFRAYDPDNDVLVYWPLRDYWMDKEGMELAMTVHNASKWFSSQPIGQTARKLYDAGYAFDYISDRMLLNLPYNGVKGSNGFNGVKGLERYSCIVVPPCRHMPEKTKARLAELAAAGMKVVWNGEAPAAARREPFAADAGLMYARYRKDGATVYFIVNAGVARVRRTFRPAAKCASAWTMDPMTGRIAALSVSDGELSLDIRPGHSTILYVSSDAAPYAAVSSPKTGKPFEVKGEWTLTPVAGGPDPMPAVRKMSKLSGWERLADGTENPFCGTMRYSVVFDAQRTDARVLDLGDVRQSAKVTLNGRDLGKVFMAPFLVDVPPGVLKPSGNLLEVEVTSVAANRIRKMDRDGTPWRIFHDINFASYKGGLFDASKWPLTVNGLIGPVVFDPEEVR